MQQEKSKPVKMTFKKLFENLKSNPVDVLLSFSEFGKVYQLNFLSETYDPFINFFPGWIICIRDIDKRKDYFKFKISSSVFIHQVYKPVNKSLSKI